MKTITNKVFSFILILFSVNSFSQEISETKTVGQIIEIEATIPVVSFILNYNYIITNTNTIKPYLGLGLQYFPHSKSNDKVFMLYPQAGILIGNTNAFDVNIGASFDFRYGEHMPSLYAGYRYLSKTNHFSFKAGLTMFYLGKSEGESSLLDLPALFPSPTIGFGYWW